MFKKVCLAGLVATVFSFAQEAAATRTVAAAANNAKYFLMTDSSD